MPESEPPFEIIHDFDSVGRFFDEFGNFNDWWNTLTQLNSGLRTQCMVDQYNAFRPKPKGRHGKSEQRLGGLNYNPNQLFWIAAAQKWCSVERWDILAFFLLRDEHTPPEFRVKGIFANSYDFARDFHCLPDQKMNPYKKCAVW
ncbi:Endothelin-converting enzyme 1 [Orchesella cincta]|uniref:Endothelin-converting enzyme 1 n=1 Tax=Orchesella cincta TaxID=48709 RepID=A0A1D2MPU0_ORCCI|nr:Endothelin-converting enzyme 1 [Orchesella cincta]